MSPLTLREKIIHRLRRYRKNTAKIKHGLRSQLRLPVASFAFLFLRNLRNLWINPFSEVSGPWMSAKKGQLFPPDRYINRSTGVRRSSFESLISIEKISGLSFDRVHAEVQIPNAFPGNPLGIVTIAVRLTANPIGHLA
jgi:hypothetical protein